MDRSFINIHAVEEYYGNTAALLPEFSGNEPVYMRSIGINELSIDVAFRRADGYSDSVLIRAETYDEAMESIKPWLPAPFYAEYDGVDGLFFVSNPNHYKRSASIHRYMFQRPCYHRLRDSFFGDSYDFGIQMVHEWTRVNRSIEEAASLASDKFAIVNDKIGLLQTRDRLHILYLGAPIGYVDSNFRPVIHPLYEGYLGGVVQDTWENAA